jgi:hypothetical protein
MVEIKKAKVDNKLYNVVGLDTYAANPDLYPINNTAIAVDGMVLPLRNKTDITPGLYDAGAIMQIYKPRDGDLSRYKEENLEIIDLGGSKTTKEFMERSQKVKEINKTILENDTDAYVATRLGDETPEMSIFKDAIDAKRMNIRNYETAIEENGGRFNNDIRIIGKKNISFDKMKMFGNSFDMKITVIIEDKNEDVPNPMGTSFSCVITGE